MMRSGILVRLKQCSHKRSNSSQTTNATLKHEAALTQPAEPAEQCIDWFG